tara:strand:- start:860 stop:1273 length:414 start_codon:yes stop_codon:yes gene_type:complete
MGRIRKLSNLNDDTFDDIYEGMHPLWSESEKCLEPLIEVSTGQNEITVTVDLPCVANKEDISLKISNDTLEIKAVLHHSVKWERWGTVQRDILFDSFKKIIVLPKQVDPTNVKAKFINHLLIINIPIIRQKFNIKID